MDTYKKNIKLIRMWTANIQEHVRNDRMDKARGSLLALVRACFDLSVDLHRLSIRSRFAKLYPTTPTAPAPKKVTDHKKPRARRGRLSNEDKELIRTMTKAGHSMRDIAEKLNRTPSLVWRWQKKLGVKKGKR